jgi:hypothetical protein
VSCLCRASSILCAVLKKSRSTMVYINSVVWWNQSYRFGRNILDWGRYIRIRICTVHVWIQTSQALSETKNALRQTIKGTSWTCITYVCNAATKWTNAYKYN